MNLNICHLAGRLTRDPELRVTPKGTAICQFGIAINRTYTDASGQKLEDVTFLDVEAWGKTGETIAKYCTKGRPIYIQGRLKLDQWEDKTTQEKRSKIKVVCETFQFIGGRDEGGDGHQPDAPNDADQTRDHRQPPRAPSGSAPPRRAQPAPDGHNVNTDDIDPDSVPF